MSKPKVLLFVMCEKERSGWVHPGLVYSLLCLHTDPRFSFCAGFVFNQKPVQFARNHALTQARQHGVAMCIMVDNDQVPPDNFGDIIAASIAKRKLVVGLRTGVVRTNNLPALLPSDSGQRDGEFQETRTIGTGIILIASEVWKKIPRGPWFRWLENDDEVLSMKLSEDLYFVQQLLPKHGIKVWVHDTPAAHMKTVDVAEMAKLQWPGPIQGKCKPWEAGFSG
jgi:hypothetical protein